ncbi:MAG: alpha/beta hydrolase [Phycisphaerales bacterium]
MSLLLSVAMAIVLAGDPPTAGPANPAPAAAAQANPNPVPAAAASPAIGMWQGSISAEGGSLFVALDITPGPDVPIVTITAPKAGAVRAPGKKVSAQNRSLAFSLESAGVIGRFSGEIAADGASYSGSLELGRPGGEKSSLPFTLQRMEDPRTAANRVRWEGTLELGQMKLPMAFTVAEFAPDRIGGVVDIPLQSLEAFPMTVTKSVGDDGRGHWKFVIPVGIDATVELAQVDADTLRGTFRQGAADLPLELKRCAGAPTVALNRPQTPKPPFPYRQRDALIGHRFGHSLAGTLTLPARTPQSPEKFPAVILVTGSGPQDRDETIFGHKPFLVLADALARAGIAVFRYDDRGVGLSTGSFAHGDTYDFATDADEVSEWLKRQPEIDPTRIGIIGHSEGGLIAPIVAAWQTSGDLGSSTPISFIVLLAGPGVNGREILHVQNDRLMKASGVGEADRKLVLDAHDKFIAAALTTDASDEALVAAARELVRVQAELGAKAGGPAPTQEQLDASVQAAVTQMKSRWMRTFLTLDPALWIASLHIPILTMNGTLDTQVDIDQNVPAIMKAAAVGGAPVTAKRYEGLNHMFQPAKTGGVEEYANIETTIDPTALQDLVEWVVARGKERPLWMDRDPNAAGAKPALPEPRTLPSGAPTPAPVGPPRAGAPTPPPATTNSQQRPTAQQPAPTTTPAPVPATSPSKGS